MVRNNIMIKVGPSGAGLAFKPCFKPASFTREIRSKLSARFSSKARVIDEKGAGVKKRKAKKKPLK